MDIPKIPLRRTLAVTLAAMKNRPLYCIVHRCTPPYAATVRALLTHDHVNATTRTDLESMLRKCQDWHITEVSGEFLTIKAAVKNAALENASGDWRAFVCTYTADECHTACVRPTPLDNDDVEGMGGDAVLDRHVP